MSHVSWGEVSLKIDAIDLNSNANKVSKSGDSMTGPLNMNSYAVTSTSDPANENQLCRKGYVDTADALKFDKVGGAINGIIDMTLHRITNLAPSQYVNDAVTRGELYALNVSESVETYTEPFAIDAQTPGTVLCDFAGDLVLPATSFVRGKIVRVVNINDGVLNICTHTNFAGTIDGVTGAAQVIQLLYMQTISIVSLGNGDYVTAGADLTSPRVRIVNKFNSNDLEFWTRDVSSISKRVTMNSEGISVAGGIASTSGGNVTTSGSIIGGFVQSEGQIIGYAAYINTELLCESVDCTNFATERAQCDNLTVGKIKLGVPGDAGIVNQILASGGSSSNAKWISPGKELKISATELVGQIVSRPTGTADITYVVCESTFVVDAFHAGSVNFLMTSSNDEYSCIVQRIGSGSGVDDGYVQWKLSSGSETYYSRKGYWAGVRNADNVFPMYEFGSLAFPRSNASRTFKLQLEGTCKTNDGYQVIVKQLNVLISTYFKSDSTSILMTLV